MVVSLSGRLKWRGQLPDAGDLAAQVSNVGVAVLEGRVE
jgi:hypothetical protein